MITRTLVNGCDRNGSILMSAPKYPNNSQTVANFLHCNSIKVSNCICRHILAIYIIHEIESLRTACALKVVSLIEFLVSTIRVKLLLL